MIYENVCRLCKERGISIARLEREAGLGNATVQGWRHYMPKLKTLEIVANYFGVNINVLLAPDEEQKDE